METSDSLQTKTSRCLVADGQLESIWSQLHYATKDTQPSQTCSEGYTFSATALYRGVSLFLGSIKWTRLTRLLHCKRVLLCIWGVLIGLD